ncbi:hypothetical protein E3V33_04250 [Candidatus Marinimicrobia bacterium MT.SAG.4]|nr:hypothetical protein E3V33_04250 [Candidatus Marinimicrobia bacterium MT.SAG.4]
MRRSLLVLLLIAALLPQAIAKKWTVDNNPGNSADFATLPLAHDGAADGDTLYVRGSTVGYDNLVVKKKLYIFGPGYFLTENPSTQSFPVPATLGTITFSNNSTVTSASGSLLTGFVLARVSITTFAGSVTIKRNYITGDGGNIPITIDRSSNNVITQNHIEESPTSNSTATILNFGIATNNIISNNFILTPNIAISSTSAASLIVRNNVIKGDVTIFNSEFKNNTLTTGTYTATSSVTTNNIGDATQFGTADGNQQNVTMTSVFDGTGSTDGQWKLATGSPAIGAGVGGIDVGMYGGTDPYVLSGIPHIPNIYQFDGPTTGSTTAGLPITMKVKSNN